MFVAGSSSIFKGDISDYRDNIRELRKSIIWQGVFMKVSVIVTDYNLIIKKIILENVLKV